MFELVKKLLAVEAEVQEYGRNVLVWDSAPIWFGEMNKRIELAARIQRELLTYGDFALEKL